MKSEVRKVNFLYEKYYHTIFFRLEVYRKILTLLSYTATKFFHPIINSYKMGKLEYNEFSRHVQGAAFSVGLNENYLSKHS